jgi:mannose-1-phosphate guanylyltransferase/mannose-6-phosphate isomerase
MSILIPVILSGGAGTRLWPVSRRTHPKPFMRLADGQTLLARTLSRALAVADESAPIYTVTARDYQFLTRDEYQLTAPGLGTRARYLLEPAARNTAPALLLAAFGLAREFGDDAVMLVLPADHLIRDLAGFSAAAATARRLAEQDYLVTFGVIPTRPETAYGYIQRGNPLGRDGFSVTRFVEKPDRETAERYLLGGKHWWNSGMFCFRAAALLGAARVACRDLYAGVERCAAATDWSAPAVQFARDLFLALPSISIDYAVMERAPDVAVVPAPFDWSDIGSWRTLGEQTEPDAAGNRVSGDAWLVDARDCHVRAEARTVALLGVSELTVIETRDAILIAQRDRDQDVKRIVEALGTRNHPTLEAHATVHRPWGSYTVLEDAADCKVKRLVVKPGEVLSLQLHHHRSEHWTVVRGTAKVRVGEREFELHENESAYIPAGSVHRLENATGEDIALIEVQTGSYFGEDDIVRLEDRYGRVLG